MTSVSEIIAARCADRTLPTPLARTRAACAIADTVACIIAGRDHDTVRRLREALRADAGSARATAIGLGRCAVGTAAMINATASHTLEFDDNFWPAMTHGSAVAVPTVLAVAEAQDATGRDMVDAYLAALEGQAMAAEGLRLSHYRAGWHATGTVGTIGSAAGAAILMGMDAAGIARALTAAVSYACGTKGQFGTSIKPIHAGIAARNAVEAALLAHAGISGNPAILEGEQGFLELFGGRGAPGWDLERLAAPRPHVMDAVGIQPKLHPCCGSSHMALDMLAGAMSELGFGSEDVAGIRVKVGISNQRNLPYRHPENSYEAKFSMNYAVLTLLKKRHLTLHDFSDAVDFAAVPRDELDMIAVDTWSEAEEIEAGEDLPHLMEIALKDGRTIRLSRVKPRGSAEEPISVDEYRRKFNSCCAGTFGEDRSDRLFLRIMDIDNQPDLTFIADSFRQAAA